MPARKPKNTTGTIDKTPAQLEAERRYEQSKSNPPPSGAPNPRFDDTVRNQQNQQDLEAQRRYDSSSTLPTDSRYQAPNSTLQSAAANALRGAGRNTAPARTVSSSGARSGGSSSGGGSAVPAAPTLEEQLAAIQNITGTIDPRLSQYVPNAGKIGLMYGQFDQAIGKNREDLTKSYDESIQNIRNNYAQSNNVLNAAVGQDQATLQQAAANLGVGGEYAASPVNQNLSEALNRFVGSNAGNQATDLAWFEKLKNLDDSNLANWLAVSQRDKLDLTQDSSNRMQDLQIMADEQARALATQELMTQLAALGGGGGSGGGGGGRGSSRRGGGGSSSGAGTYAQDVENAELDAELEYVGLQETIASLPPNLRQLAIDYWVKGGATGKGAANKVLSAMEALGNGPADKFVTKPGYVDPRDNNPFINPGSYQSRTNTGINSGMLNQIYQALLGYVPGLAAIETAQTTDASRRTTRNYDDVPHQPRENPVGLFDLNPPAPKAAPAKKKSSGGLANAIGRRVKVI